MDYPELPGTEALQTARALRALERADSLGRRYGLALHAQDTRMLAERQRDALRGSGRVEFGEGPYPALIAALCDSPYLNQHDYAETLGALCELFYSMKTLSGERWSDEELVAAIAQLFSGACHGSVELVGDRLWQALHELEMPAEPDSAEEAAHMEEDWFEG